MNSREDFENAVRSCFHTEDHTFKRDGEFGPYLMMVQSKRICGKPSDGECVRVQSLYNLMNALGAKGVS